MNKNIKKIIAASIAAGTITAITPAQVTTIMTTPAYAASYKASTGELKDLKIESSKGDSLELRDDYDGDEVYLSKEKVYYAKLTGSSTGVIIDAEVKGEDYVVKIFTSSKDDAKGVKPGELIELEKGETTLYIRTYESERAYKNALRNKDVGGECEEEYELNIKKTSGSSYEDDTQDEIFLDNISLNKGDITFLKRKSTYDITVDSSVNEIKITAEPEDTSDRVRINGDLVDEDDKYRKTVSLKAGKNEVKIKITDNKDNQRVYTLNITRKAASGEVIQDNIYLSDIVLDEGDISFDADETSYDIELDEDIDELEIQAIPEDEENRVTIDGTRVTDSVRYKKIVELEKGKNEIQIKVRNTSTDEQRIYTLNVYRGEVEEEEEKEEENSNTNSTTNVNDGTPNAWVKVGEGWQRNDANGKPLKQQWFEDTTTAKKYYLKDDGFRGTGWQFIEQKWYLFNSEGVMLTGWQYTGGTWYFMDEQGVMKTDWLYDRNSGIWYYLNDNGAMATGWLYNGGKWYYLNTSGAMQTGWITDKGVKYYLNSSGAMVTGTAIIEGKTYYFNSNGSLKE